MRAYMHMRVWRNRHIYCTACASVCVWPNSVSLWTSFGAYRDSFAFSRLPLPFFPFSFGGFRSEQLLNGHSSSETGHWEAQRGLARVSALPNIRAVDPDTHTHTHAGARTNTCWGPRQVKPGSAMVVRVRCDHFADVFLPKSDFGGFSHCWI